MGGASSSDQPLLQVDTAEVWPMAKFDATVAADLFAGTAKRGNPVLSAVDDSVLRTRGIEMARHARHHPCSFIATVEGKPVGVMFAWDGADEPELTPHPSLSVHAALHSKTMELRQAHIGDVPRGRMCHAAYGGVLPGYPAHVLLMLSKCLARGMWTHGYSRMYGVAINPVTAHGTRTSPGGWRWHVNFDDVVLPNGSRPLAGVPPHRAEVIHMPTLFSILVLGSVPNFAIPYIANRRGQRARAAAERRAAKAPSAKL
eukprot:TRINITY_DN1142_c0_g3_i1.p1 TRINITY_DN1142_c0_g3~~TRINITY_DN1142_c0_g3_i1.p1  ORF type:complete len:277 (+),score=55.15 TRINITY_DN1142_c0_g3_i1:60-833(+)